VGGARPMERIEIKTLLEKENKKPFKEMTCEIDAYKELTHGVYLLRKAKVGSQNFQPSIIDENRKKVYILKKGRLQERDWK
jgi:hypothetical protein